MGSNPTPTRGSSFFLGRVTALGVLLCFVVCMPLLASFFLSSAHLIDLYKMYIPRHSRIGRHNMLYFINPRRMRSEGYSSRSVCLFVCQQLFSHYRLRGGL